MSKSIKQMMMNDYTSRLGGIEDAMIISLRGVKATDTNRLRTKLAKKNIKVTVVRNALARKVMEGTKLQPLGDLLTGSNALAYGQASIVEIAREIVGMMKELPGMELKGAILDGTVFAGDARVKELSKFPTRQEAIADLIAAVLGPGRTLASQIKGPGAKAAGLVKAIEDKLEKGETITKVA